MVVFKITAFDLLVVRHCRVNCTSFIATLLLSLPLFWLRLARWISCWERTSHLALQLSCPKIFCGVFSFPPGVYVGTLDLIIASIPGPSILTLLFKQYS